MVSSILIYAGSGAVFLWGIGHFLATRPVLTGFGPLSQDNHRLVSMEWILEGATLCFIGVLVGLVEVIGGRTNSTDSVVIRACAAMLLVMAMVSARTGARTSILPMKICPLVKTAVALAYIVGDTLG